VRLNILAKDFNMDKLQSGHKLFHVGERVPTPGRYVLVDEKGEKQNFSVYLAEGEAFPMQKIANCAYMLVDERE
jgi:hypothetical protein